MTVVIRINYRRYPGEAEFHYKLFPAESRLGPIRTWMEWLR